MIRLQLKKQKTPFLQSPKFLLQFIGLLGVIAFFYRNAILNTYAWSDDYPTLVDPSSHVKHTLQDLRPGYAVLLTLFEILKTSADLQAIRFISVVSLTLTCFLIWRILLKYDFGASALIGSLVSIATPPFASLVYFATGFGVLIAQSLAALSFYFFARGKTLSSVLGYAFLVSAFLTYPISAWIYIVIATVILVFSTDSLKSAASKFTRDLRKFVLAGIFAFVLAYSYLKVDSDASLNGRVQIISLQNAYQDIKFFITRFLVQSFRFFLYDRPENYQIALQATLTFFVYSLISIYSSRSKGVALKRLILGLVGVVLMSLPYLLLSYNQIEPRFFATTSLFLTLLFFRNIEIIISNTKVKLTTRFNAFSLNVIESTLICLCLVISNQLTTSIYENRVRPITSSTEAFLTQSLTQCSEQEKVAGVVIWERSKPWPSLKYLGMFSQVTDLASDWVPRNATELVLRDPKWQFVVREKIQVMQRTEDLPMNYCVIDMDLFEAYINEK